MTVAVVTGANRGIGLEVVRRLAERGWAVVLGSRDVERGRRAARGLDGVVVRPLDVADPASVDALATWAQVNVLGAWRMRWTCSRSSSRPTCARAGSW